jgi:flagellar hook-length control protein FliK
VAENQQVKEVLESNMHLLKDSLESQGMNVQGFSVSVRQDSDRHRMNWERQNDSRGPTLRGASARSSLSVGGLTDFSSSERIADPYQWEDSTINLTA